MELVRTILLQLESLPAGQETLKPEDVDGYDRTVVSQHIQLLAEAELIEARIRATFAAPTYAVAGRITWGGHEFLDATRSATVWQRVKAKLAEEGGTLPLTVLKELAIAYTRQRLDLGS